MGIWDKSRVLSGERLDVRYPEGKLIVVYAMKYAGVIDLDNGMEPARMTKLVCRGAVPGKFQGSKLGQGYELDPEDGEPGEAHVVSIMSSPVAAMAESAGEGDFPVVVRYAKVETKAGNKANVLEYVKMWTPGKDEPTYDQAMGLLAD